MNNADKSLKWSFAQVWNEALENGVERTFKPRDYIWASEIGGSYIDRYMKMTGEKPSNPPNPRSMRKFEAGNMMEWVVEMVLRRAGVLVTNQEYVNFQYPNLLKVTGKLDFLAGGKIDWDKARSEIATLQLPDFFNRATSKIIEHLSTKYPQGLEKIVLEIKSCSSFMFERYEKAGADLHHELQLFHYLKSKDLPEGHLVYISRDDLRLLEFGVMNPSVTESFYLNDIREMTNIYSMKKQPKPEPLVVFDHQIGRFSRNWKVAYSNYLTKLYGYKDQMAYDTEWTAKMGSWNRVFGRCVKGDKMTDLNLTVIEEIKVLFPDFAKLVKEAKEKGVDPEAPVAEEVG